MSLADPSVDFTDVEWVVVLNDPDNTPFSYGPTLMSNRDDGIVTDEGDVRYTVGLATQPMSLA